MRYLWLFTLSLSLPVTAAVEQQLALCAAIDDKLERLICYDQLAENTQATSPTSAVSMAATNNEPAAIQPAAGTDGFGKIKTSATEPSRIELEIASVEKDRHDNLQLTFTNGQVWKQTESRRYRLKAGDKVFIKKGALNAFYLGTDKQNATIRVKRVN